MFDRRTAEQKAAAAAHQAAVAKAAADEREAARVAATPLGQAVAAKERGDRFFQMQIPISSLEGDSSFGEPTSRFTNHGPRGGLLGEIEDLGWHLEHTGFVFIETASVSTNSFVRTGQGTAQRGLLVGVYLFREVPGAGDRPPAESGPSGETAALEGTRLPDGAQPLDEAGGPEPTLPPEETSSIGSAAAGGDLSTSPLPLAHPIPPANMPFH